MSEILPAHIRFANLIREKNMTNEQVGNMMPPKPVSKQSVGKWCRGICPPSKLTWRLFIEAWSGGDIKPTDWPD